MKRGNEHFTFNTYKGTLIKIMRSPEASKSDKSYASKLYMLKLLKEEEVRWIKKYENKFKKVVDR